jgi:acetolactate synthase-1/2/3 large subunit
MKYKKQPNLKKTGAFALLDNLVKNGTKHIFGYPGGAILPIYDELYRWEQQDLIKHFLVRHEQAAVHAADSYARVTNEIGVCFATSGPGATNLVTGIANAQMDSVPMVIVTGQVGRSFIGTDAFQETDIFGITLPIVKHSYVIRDPLKTSDIVSEAYYIAQNGRPGPVLIDIPKDVGLEEIKNYKGKNQYDIVRMKSGRFTYRVNSRQIVNTLNLIKQASQPLLYVGGGILSSNASNELIHFSRLFNIPITTTLMGKGACDESNFLSLGMLGMHGTAYANFAVSECDLLITLGARFDDRVTGKLDEFATHSQVIHIDIDPAEVGKNRIPEIALVGDIKTILQLLLLKHVKQPAVDHEQTNTWLERIAKWRKLYPLIITKGEKSLAPQEIISYLNLNADRTYYTTDVGQHQMWSAQFIRCNVRHWSSSAGLGTMGYGLPAAIGSQIAHPQARVICITGDSSIQMNIQELGTIAQYNLPIKIIILNNGWQGMVRQWQQSFYGERYSHSRMQNGTPDFARLAQAYNIEGINISDNTNILNIMQTTFIEKANSPTLINCFVVEDTNCYPMVAPGKSNSQMMGIFNKKNLNKAPKFMLQRK